MLIPPPADACRFATTWLPGASTPNLLLAIRATYRPQRQQALLTSINPSLTSTSNTMAWFDMRATGGDGLRRATRRRRRQGYRNKASTDAWPLMITLSRPVVRERSADPRVRDCGRDASTTPIDTAQSACAPQGGMGGDISTCTDVHPRGSILNGRRSYARTWRRFRSPAASRREARLVPAAGSAGNLAPVRITR